MKTITSPSSNPDFKLCFILSLILKCLVPPEMCCNVPEL